MRPINMGVGGAYAFIELLGLLAPGYMQHLSSRVISTTGSAEGATELCNHFCQFGTCKHEAKCNFVHDKDKVQHHIT